MRFKGGSLFGGLAVVLAALLIVAATSAAAEEAPAGTEGATIFSLAPGAHALSMTIGADGNLWFAGTTFLGYDGEIGRVTPDGQVTEFPLSGSKSHHYAQGIATGPDGNLWFTQPEANKIGRITTSGEITQFSLPGDDGQPTEITAGPDGNLWFTEEAASRIGRITPGGEIAEFSLASGRHPAGIVAGPDGNLWFTEKGANRIGHITTSGEIAESQLPGKDRKPNAITVGPDGNLWFTEEATNKIGRIAPDGAIAQFRVPVLGPGAIATGPDGNLWFTTYSQVGSISPSGQPGQMSCLTVTCRLPAISITTGHDGELWVGTSTEYPVYGGGMTAITVGMQQPGYIAKLFPPPRRMEFGSNAGVVAGRRTDVSLSCEAPTGCRGALRLTRPLSAYPGGPAFDPRRLVMGHRRYELASGERRSVRVLLTRRAAKLLSQRGSLSAWATAGVRTHTEAIQLIVLRKQGASSPSGRQRVALRAGPDSRGALPE
ncbi:MAG TPA: hypothetical protein VKC63_00145 [Solirubrobacterales bacterium]|nr:hypothetical protein [Solirubrobacterales bacterium]